MFEIVKEEILNCRLCAERFGFEPHPIFVGNENAKIMHIGQAPSKTVHNTGKPFDDASGKKLRGEWYQISDAAFYHPDNFYITAIAHCYPGKSPGGGDRPPPKLCTERWLRREIAAVKPELFILLGGYAAGFFFPRQNFASLVFQDQTIQGKPAYVLPHPSPLNIKWFKDHPEFLESRVEEVRRAIHRVLGLGV